MKNSVEYLNDTRVKLDVEVPADEFSPAYEKAAKTLAKQVNIPGFRKGKAPRRVLEANIGKGYIIEQAINDNLDAYYQQAAAEAGVTPMSRPEVEINEVPEMKGAKDETALKFSVVVDVAPEISLPDPAKITIEVPSVEVTDEDVEAALTDLRERFASLSDVDRETKKGDYVNIDLVAKIGDEEVDDMAGVSYKIGDGNMLEGQDEALTGVKAGDTVEFSAKLAGGAHEGEEAQVTVKVHSVKESVLPEADDDFAQLASEFDTIAELKADLRENAAKTKANQQLMGAEQKLVDELLKAADFPLPQSVVEEGVKQHLAQEEAGEDAAHAEEVRKEVTQQLKLQLLLDAYAQGYGIDVSQDELLNFLMSQAQIYGMDPNGFIQAAAKANQIGAFAGELARNKGVIASLRRANVVDAKGEKVDVSAILGEAPEDEKTPEFEKKIEPKVPVEEKPATEAETEDAAPAEKTQAEAPAKSALKADWIAYRVATGELTEAEAKKLTKEQLIEYQA